MRTPAALDAARAIIAEVDDIIVGIGTVIKPLDVTHAVDAGADFLVSPGTPAELAQALADAPVPALPGCATVSEAMTLAALGFPVLKFFPAEPSGGVRWLNAVAEPLPDIRFCPTGGVNGDNAASYLALRQCAGGRRLLGRAGGRPSPRAISPASPRAPASRPRCAADARVLRSAHPAPPAQSLRLVVRDHRGRGRRLRGRRLSARRPGAVSGNPLQRPRAVRRHPAQGAGGLPDRGLRRRADAARDGDALGRRRVRACSASSIATLGRRDLPRRPDHHLPDRGGLRRDRRRHRRRDRLHHQLDLARLRPHPGLGVAVLRRRFRDLAHPHLDPAADRRRACWRGFDRRTSARRGGGG